MISTEKEFRMNRNLQRYSQSYLNHPFEAIQARYRKKCVVENIMKYKHKNIVEIGCGLDSLINDFGDFDQCFIIEPSELFFEKIECDLAQRPKLNNKVTLANLKVEDVKSLPFKPDMIIASGLLHEVERPENILAHLLTLCTSDTVIHINVPNAYSLHRLLAKEAGLISDVHEKSSSQISLQQHSTFDFARLSALAKHCGFKVIDKGTYFIKPFTHQQMQQLIDLNLLNEKLLNGFYSMSKYFPDNGSELFMNLRTTKQRK